MNTIFDANTAVQHSDFALVSVSEVGCGDLHFDKTEFYFASNQDFNKSTDFKIKNEYEVMLTDTSLLMDEVVQIHAPCSYTIADEIVKLHASNDEFSNVLH